jgi:ribonuclease HII
MIIGIDEVGLGAWAGPLVVCAFAAPDEEWTVPGLTDSKAFKGEAQVYARSQLSARLVRDFPQHHVLIAVDAVDIDARGIGAVLPMAMNRALERLIDLVGLPDRVIIDGEDKHIPGAEFVAKADMKFPCVSAASVIAKVYRDDYMTGMAADYPQYGFVSHVGYGTKEHRAAIDKIGLCPLHRLSYQPMRGIVEARTPK